MVVERVFDGWEKVFIAREKVFKAVDEMSRVVDGRGMFREDSLWTKLSCGCGRTKLWMIHSRAANWAQGCWPSARGGLTIPNDFQLPRYAPSHGTGVGGGIGDGC